MNRIISFGLAGLMVMVVAVGWLLGISPLLDQAASADDQRSSVQDLNDVNEAKITDLKVKFETIDTLRSQVASMRVSVPERLDIPAFLRGINGYCATNSVTLVSVTVDTAEVFMAAPEATPPVAEAAPAAPEADAVVPAVEAPTGPTLVRVPIQVTVDGDYNAVMAFGGSLQTGPRLFLATSFTMAKTPTGFTGVLGGFVYALPPVAANPAVVAGEVAGQEAAGVAPQG
jgi:Tfp pilus assembly protein PilO